MNFVYIFIAKSQPFKCKIGISGNPDERTKGVNRKVTKVMALPFSNAKWVEGFLHGAYQSVGLRRRIKGNGGTEWVVIANVLSSCIACYFFGLAGAIFLVIPFPFDVIILLFLGWVVEISLIVAAIIAVLWVFSKFE